jgi:hypothetical protein
MKIHTVETLLVVSELSSVDVKTAAGKMKSQKSPGMEQILTQLIQAE